MTRVCAVLVTLAIGIPALAQTTYYVSPAGSDANTGKSRGSAWRTLTRSGELRAGDRLLLAGGATFNGSIHLKASQIALGSYGAGRATIDSGDETAIDGSDLSNLTISNLRLRGASLAHMVLNRNGIDLTNRNGRARSIRIENVEITGFSFAAIQVQAGDRLTGVDVIAIENALIHEIGYAGIVIDCDEPGAFTDVSVRHSDIGPITGYRNSYGVVVQGSGSGISVKGAYGGSISGNVVHDSGTTAGGGNFGIEIIRTIGIEVDSNEVRNMHKDDVPGAVAGAIDIDGGTSASVRYNYTHDNDGPGIRLCSCSAALKETFVHHNISQNDGSPAAIDIEGSISSSAIVVAHNTVEARSGTALLVTGLTSTLVANNLLLTHGGTAADIVSGTTMKANDYYDYAGAPRLVMNGSASSSLAGWGQDSLGLSADPQLIGGAGGALLPSASLSDLNAFRITPNSPLIDKAIDLQPSGYSIGPRDFFGGESATLFGSDIGAYEYRPDPYPPSIDPVASQAVIAGDTQDVDVWFHDADGTSGLVLSLVNPPAGVTLRRAGGEHAIVTLAPLSAGKATVTVRVKDESGFADEVSFAVTATGGSRVRAVRH